MEGPEYDLLLKILLVGDTDSDKSSIIRQYMDEIAIEQATGVNYQMVLKEIKGKKVKVIVWDIAGQERFDTITSSSYRGSHGIIVVYNISYEESLQRNVKHLKKIDEYSNNPAKILVGNSVDPCSERAITYEAGKALADNLGIPFLETSPDSYSIVHTALDRMIFDIVSNIQNLSPIQIPQDKKTVTSKRSCFLM